MKTKTANILLNSLLYLGGVTLAGTGLLLEWRLPHGQGNRMRLLGLSRHEWGAVHFYLALFVSLAVLLHLLLHWRWIWKVAASCKRRWLFVAAVLTVAILGFFSLVPVETVPGGRGGALQSSLTGVNSQR